MSSFAAELSTDGGRSWAANNWRFATKDEALRHAEEIMQRWLAVTDWRAVPSDREPNATLDDRDRPIELREIAAEVEARAIEAGLSPEAMACAQSAAENIGAPIHIEDTPITPTPMSNTTLPAEIEAKKDTLLTLVSHHVGTATFQRIQSFVLAKTGTKLQAFLTDASKPIEERAGFIDELTKILQSGDFTKLPPAAGAQAAAPKAALSPAPVATPPANGLKPAFTVPTNGVACTPACTPPPAAAPTPTQVVLTPPAVPADPIAALSAALAAIMPKPAAPAAPAIDEAAVRKLVREEMASVLASVVEALRQ